MSRLLRALGVQPGEGRIVFWSTLTLFLVGCASVQMTNVGETFFLKRVGVSLLPFVFLVNSLLLALTTFGVGRLTLRVPHRRLLAVTLAALGAALVPLWALTAGGVSSAFALLVIAAKQMDAIAMLVFWTTIGGLLSARQGKRLFAPITAGGTLGTIVGSFTSGPIGEALGIATLLPLAGVTLVAAAATTLPLRGIDGPTRLHRAALRPVVDDPTRRLLPLWREGWLFRVLTASALLAGTLGPMLYFQFSYVADLATQGRDGEQQLLALYAQVRGWMNVGILILQVVGTGWVFRRVGVPLAAALSPLVYLVGLTGLSVRLSLPAGVGAVAGASLLDHAVYDPAQRILLTLFPERVRAAVTTLIDGPVKRAGAVLGNLVIIGALAVGTPVWVGFAGLPIAGAWFVLALVLWRRYPSLLLEVASARRRDPDEPVPLADMIDPGTMRVLEQGLAAPDLERCRVACELVVEAPPARATAALARALRLAPPPNRPVLVGTLQRLLHAEPGLGPVADAARDLAGALAAPEGLAPLDRARLVQAYARLAGAREALPELERLAADPSAAVRTAALAARHRVQRDDGDDALVAALTSADPTTRHVAREELRAELLADGAPDRWEPRVRALTARLAVAEDRAHAAAVLADVAARHGSRTAAHALPVLAHRADPDPEVRAAVVRFAGHARLARQARWIVQHLAAEEPVEMDAAREALLALGPAVADVLLDTLRFGRRRARAAVLGILHRMPVDPPTLRGLVDRELDVIRTLLVQADALGAGGASELVLQRLQERVDESVHTVLLLLAALHDDDRLARLGRLLGRARTVRDRALLLEALEALLPGKEREHLLPLLEDLSLPSRARTAARALRRTLPSFEEALGEAVGSDDDPLTSALLATTVDAATLARHAPAFDARTAAAWLVRHRPETADAGVDPGPVRVSYETQDTHVLSPVETILHLRSLDLFDRLTTRQLTELAAVVDEVTMPSGAPIVREGEFEDCMYFIVSGHVRISRGEEVLADLGPREFFGEMAVFDGETRSATATAVGPVRLLRLVRHDLFQVMEEQPAVAITICQTLTRRLRDLNERLEASPPRAGKERPHRDAG